MLFIEIAFNENKELWCSYKGNPLASLKFPNFKPPRRAKAKGFLSVIVVIINSNSRSIKRNTASIVISSTVTIEDELVAREF